MHRIVLALLAIGVCACSATAEQLKTRAAFDLGCPSEQIRVYEIDGRTRGVRGCGQQATYVEVCQQAVWGKGPLARDCTWALNTDARPAPATQNQAPAPLRCGPGTVEQRGMCVAPAEQPPPPDAEARSAGAS